PPPAAAQDAGDAGGGGGAGARLQAGRHRADGAAAGGGEQRSPGPARGGGRHGGTGMSDPVRFLTSLGQALSATTLYREGHPARERAVDQAWEQLTALQQYDPTPNFSFLEEEVLYRQQALRDFKAWDWARRLARAGVQRVEFDREATREDL